MEEREEEGRMVKDREWRREEGEGRIVRGRRRGAFRMCLCMLSVACLCVTICGKRKQLYVYV